MITYLYVYFLLEDKATDLNAVGAIVKRKSAADWNSPDPEARGLARSRWREYMAVRDEYERGMEKLRKLLANPDARSAVSPADQLWLEFLMKRLAGFVTPHLVAANERPIKYVNPMVPTWAGISRGWVLRAQRSGTPLRGLGAGMGFGPGMLGRVGGPGVRGGSDPQPTQSRQSSQTATGGERLDPSTRPGSGGMMSGPAGSNAGDSGTGGSSTGPAGGATQQGGQPNTASKMVWDRSTVEDMLALEKAQQELEQAEKEAREAASREKEAKEKKQNETQKSNDAKGETKKGPSPPEPPPPPPPPSSLTSRPNPDDEGGASESVHRPFHLGLGVGPAPRRGRVTAELRATLLAHGIEVAPMPDDEGGPPNPYARAADLDESPGSANPPLDGPDPPAEMSPSAGRGEDPLLRDLRLRYLLALEGTQSDDVVTNPRALGFKPNPEDPDGPHGPNARVRDNPTIGGGGLRPRTGRLF